MYFNNRKDHRSNRINKENQLKKVKRNETYLLKRIGSHNGPPKVIGIIPLSDDANTLQAISSCLENCSWCNCEPENYASTPVIHANYQKLKNSKFTFLRATTDILSILGTTAISLRNYTYCD